MATRWRREVSFHASEVSEEHWHQYHHGNTHSGDPTAKARRSIGMPQLVKDFDYGQREGVERETTRGKKMQKRRREHIPLCRHKIDACQPNEQENPGHRF